MWYNMVYDFMRNQLAAVPRDLYRQRYPAIADLDRYYDKTDGVPPENNVVARNVCVGKWLEVGWHATAGDAEVAAELRRTGPGLCCPRQDGLPHPGGIARLGRRLPGDSL